MHSYRVSWFIAVCVICFVSVSRGVGSVPSEGGLSNDVNNAFSVDSAVAVERILNSAPLHTAPSIISSLEWKELALDDCIVSIDRTKTAFGRWALRVLSWPAVNVDEIQLTQACVSRLCNDSMLRSQLADCITTIADHETAIINYYDPECPLHLQAQSLYYTSFCKDRLNESSHALQAGLWLDATKFVMACTKHVVIDVVRENYLKLVKMIGGGGLYNTAYQNKHSWLYNMGNRYNPFCDALQDEGLRKKCTSPYGLDARGKVWLEGCSLGDKYILIKPTIKEVLDELIKERLINLSGKEHILSIGLSRCVVLLLCGYSLACDADAIKSIKSSLNHLQGVWDIKSRLYASMRRLVIFLNAVDKLVTLIEEHHELVQLLCTKGFGNGIKYSAPLQDLLFMLKRVSNQDGFSASHGEMLLLHKKIQALTNDLVAVLQMSGAVDALLSIVTYVHEQQASNIPICFVEFKDNQVASIQANDFWLPLLKQDPVYNDIILGYGLPNKAVMTGPNGGGKSTAMKSICYAVVFGQAWGIAPASYLKMTPFECLRTSFCPQEDIGNQLSTFMAEQQRMRSLNNPISRSRSGSKLLLAIDEPYRGTIEVESASRICKWSDELADNNMAALLLATHLEQPTHLAEKHASFANYQLQYEQPSPVSFIRTFKLVPGAALWWFADASKRAAFINSLEGVLD